MENAKKSWAIPNTDDEICPIDNPRGAIDFYMPLPDDVYEKWKKRK